MFPSRPRGEFLAGGRQRLEPRVLQLLERLEALGDRREFLERVGLQQLLHRREAQRIVFLVLLEAFALLGRTAFFVVGVGLGFFLALVLVLERNAGILLADLAVVLFLVLQAFGRLAIVDASCRAR